MNEQEVDVAQLLAGMTQGDPDAAAKLVPLVNERLRQVAKQLLNRESPAHTLQPTALVNEAYLRLIGKSQVDWKGKTHFFALGATVMRRILVDHARRKKSRKRGGDMRRIQLTENLCVTNRSDEDVLAIEDALQKLAERDARQAQIVELRFYGGLTVEEVAEVVGVSKRTIEADWQMVRAWLRRELSGEAIR